MNETASTRIHNWSATRHCRTRREVEENVSDSSDGQLKAPSLTGGIDSNPVDNRHCRVGCAP
jgi:hypothetical protein